MRVVTRLALLLPLAWCAVSPAAAQFDAPVAPCPYGNAEAVLRGADVQATLYPNSNLFYKGNHVPYAEGHIGDGYLAPLSELGRDGDPINPIAVGAFWAGGRVQGETRGSYAQFAGYPYRPGLTGDDGTPPSPEACAAADRIWIVSHTDIANYRAGQAPTADLAEWPIHLGAPVLDGDGIEGNYDLAAGDRPAIRGDVMAFWAMTDTATGPDGVFGSILGLDVTVEAFAFTTPPLHTDTFYRYTLTNRNAVQIDSAYAGLFLRGGTRLGNNSLIGTDVESHLAYFYDPDNGDQIYEIPPAIGMVVLESPAGAPNGRDDDHDGEVDESGEELGLASMRYLYKSPGPHAQPGSPRSAYFAHQGLLNDGTPVTAWGDGTRNRGPVTRYYWHGDPVTMEGWSEMNYTDEVPTTTIPKPTLRMLLGSTGPFDLAPGASESVTFALPFTQGTDPFDSVRALHRKVQAIHSAQASGAFEPSRVVVEGSAPEAPPLAIGRPRPNPFHETTTIQLQGATDTPVRVSVYDVLGRRLSTTETSAPEARVEIGGELASGVYVVRVEGRGFAETFTIAKVR